MPEKIGDDTRKIAQKIVWRFSPLTVALLGLLTVITVILSEFRFVARDEGYFLYAAKLFSQGALPYRDFFFPQTPLLPVVYGTLFRVFGASWQSGRLITAFFTALCGIGIYLLAERRAGRAAGNLALLLFSTTSLIQVWFSTAQAYSLSTSLMLLSFVAFERRNKLYLSGAFAGFAVAGRLTLAPILPILFLYALVSGTRDQRLLRARTFCIGAVFSALFLGIFLVADPMNFWQHNMGYHLDRSSLSRALAGQIRWRVLSTLIGIRTANAIAAGQFVALLFVTVISALFWLWRRRSIDVLFLCAAALFYVHLLPRPPYVEYFAVVAPLLIPLAAEGACGMYARLYAFKTGGKYLAAVLGACVLAAYVTPFFEDFDRYLLFGDGVSGVGARTRDAWRIEGVQMISRELDALSDGRPVYALWPGYLLESRAAALPHTENNFGVAWADENEMTREEHSLRRIRSTEEILEAFAAREIGAVVLVPFRETDTKMRDRFTALGGVSAGKVLGVEFLVPADHGSGH